MKILITGGGGFIGTAVKNILIDNGHYVRLLDINIKTTARKTELKIFKVAF